MASGTIGKRLSEHRTLQPAPPNEIAWVAAHGRLRTVEKSGILTPGEGPVEGLHIILDGHLVIWVDKGAGPKKVMEWRSGDVTGVLPYSRIVAPPADVIAEEPSQLVTVPREHLAEMIHECPELTGILVHVMVDRARHFTSSFLHDEKLVSLGKLSAGLAHELNNPASAMGSGVAALSDQVAQLESASRSLGALGLTGDQLTGLDALCDSVLAAPVESVLSPLQMEEREDAIRKWLEERGTDARTSEALADTPVTLDALERAAALAGRHPMDDVVSWMAAALRVRRLNAELRDASARIHGLVAAIREFTAMDRATEPEAVDVRRGLSSTLAVLGAKAREKAASVQTEIPPDLPPVRGSAGELNQVWCNLIDNALDAVKPEGHIRIVAGRESGDVVVRVQDDGPGIPEGIRERIFDPFFTTKPVGAGMGLGLDIVRRLVLRHEGRIDVENLDSGTEFRVRLPIANVGPGVEK